MKAKRMGRPVELAAPWRDMADEAGSVVLLAERLRVHPRTIQKWSKKVIDPDLPRRFLINEVAKELGLPLPYDVEELNEEYRKAYGR